MADFMADYAGEFCFRVQVAHDAARDVDVTAGQGEGVDLRRIDDGERVLQAGPVAFFRQTLADVIHVFLQRLVIVDAVLLAHLDVFLAPDLDFLRLRHGDEVRIAGDRVLRAIRQQQACGKRGDH